MSVAMLVVVSGVASWLIAVACSDKQSGNLWICPLSRHIFFKEISDR